MELATEQKATEQKARLLELSFLKELTEEEKSELAELKKIETGNTEKDKQFTKEEFEALILVQDKKWQSRFDKVNTEKTQALKAKEELEKAKLTAAERAEYDLNKKIDELKEKSNALELREIELKTIEILKENNLPFEFKNFLVNANLETTIENIKTFKMLFDIEIKNRVDKIFKEKGVSKDGEIVDTADKTKNPWMIGKDFNLTEQGKIFKENPELARSLKQQAIAVKK